MQIFTRYKRLLPDTVNGERLQVTTIYASYNKAEIDSLEETMKQTVGSGIVQTFEEDERRSDG